MSLTSLTGVGNKSSHRTVQQNEPLWVTWDPGNTDIKGMIHTQFGSEIVMPQFVRKPTANEYNTIESAHKNKKAQFAGTAIFRSGGVGYVVGQHASMVGQGQNLLSVDKYQKDHFSALFEATMIQLYPRTHMDVRVVVMHPAKLTIDALKLIFKALKREHHVILSDGSKITYNVTAIIDMEEPVAALQTYLLTQAGETADSVKNMMTPNSEFLVLDIGGQISSMVPCIINRFGKVEVNLTNPPVFQSGIKNVMDTLRQELKSMSSGEFGNVETLRSSVLQTALMTGFIDVRGKDVDVRNQVTNSMMPIVGPIREAYNGQFNNGIGYKFIVTSGGGGAIAFDFINETVLQHAHSYMAEIDREKMRYGGIRGASKGLIIHLSQVKAPDRRAAVPNG